MNAFEDLQGLSGLGNAASLQDQKPDEFTYGELPRSSFLRILDEVGAKRGETYYDLGAGDGKTVALAWAAGLKAKGIELLEKRFALSCVAVEKIEAKGIAPRAASRVLEYEFGSFLSVGCLTARARTERERAPTYSL